MYLDASSSAFGGCGCGSGMGMATLGLRGLGCGAGTADDGAAWGGGDGPRGVLRRFGRGDFLRVALGVGSVGSAAPFGSTYASASDGSDSLGVMRGGSGASTGGNIEADTPRLAGGNAAEGVMSDVWLMRGISVVMLMPLASTLAGLWLARASDGVMLGSCETPGDSARLLSPARFPPRRATRLSTSSVGRVPSGRTRRPSSVSLTIVSNPSVA
mmetsp:Transcript_6431/g.14099  ORF Transcript_6431/g.14099 Transcript_6431/m.14099 type:complete len:214 (-) Transcript_6431:185-826(-)